MMDEPVLIVMAAGMGSRFGGLKQITPVDDNGQILMDFSLYDAWKAGFRKAVFVIKEENESSFRALLSSGAGKKLEIDFAFQRADDLPEGYSLPEGRTKPWGTAHAVRSCRSIVSGPFAVINADDYYGKTAFSAIYDYLVSEHPDKEHCMVAYRLRNTVTENGHVARGCCVTENGWLKEITERTHIEKRGSDAAYTADGVNFVSIGGDTPVSMNLWGFNAGMMDAFDRRFSAFLDTDAVVNPLKAEYFLPSVADAEMKENGAKIRVLPCEETWHGVTYREDLPSVQEAIASLKEKGQYPDKLWN